MERRVVGWEWGGGEGFDVECAEKREREDSLRVKRSQLLVAMSRACDLGEAKEVGHGQRVAKLALAVSREVGERKEDGRGRAELAVAALLHDIGISSVTYNLYERLRGQERELLKNYPSVTDEVSALSGVREGEALHFILERHAEIGAGMVRHLGYGEGAARLVEGHHKMRGGESGLQVLAVCDRLETATKGMKRGWEERVRGCLERQVGVGLRRDIGEVLERLLGEGTLGEMWGVGEGVESELDGLWGGSYGEWVGAQELEAHLRLLAQVVDAQSPFTAGHTLDVTRLARRMGEHLGLGSEDLDGLSLAGLIHGVGRLGLPASIIEKSGGLSDEEFETLHLYPNLTREALKPLEPLRGLVDAASTHREKLDGSGYPEGRTEGEIPLIGRVLAVADTYNALISDRPYRSGYGRSRALAILRAEGTRLFDGLAIDALEAVCREGF